MAARALGTTAIRGKHGVSRVARHGTGRPPREGGPLSRLDAAHPVRPYDEMIAGDGVPRHVHEPVFQSLLDLGVEGNADQIEDIILSRDIFIQ